MKRVLLMIVLTALLAGCSTTTGGSTGEKISKAEYNQIKSGMTYEEVVEIVGSEGEIMSEVGDPKDELYTFVVMWEGEGQLGANANFTFQGGKMEMKAQVGLE